jgi:hypothetical protein
MSHILFGDFVTKQFNLEQINNIKSYSSERSIYYWFNKEINFYSDIHTMLKEQLELENSINFCITTSLQPTNSDDLLLPYDKYNSKTLFPNGVNERKDFNKYCKVNLDNFYNTFLYFYRTLNPERIRVFITEGYDCNFEVKKCTIEMMIQDIEIQVMESHMLDSIIYEIIL